MAVCKLIGPDLINAVFPTIVELLEHPSEMVRKKAVMALHRFVQLDPTKEGPLSDIQVDRHFRQALCDKVATSVWNAARAEDLLLLLAHLPCALGRS